MNYITVYAASSAEVDKVYLDAARELGTLIARGGYGLVTGAGSTGLMGAVNDGAIAASGSTVGIIPQFMADRGWAHRSLEQTIVTPDMHARKSMMMRMASAVIALPGGVGTFEELLEAITWRQLGLYDGKVVILNVGGYYDPLLAMLERAATLHFMRGDRTDMWQVADTPARAMEMAVSH